MASKNLCFLVLSGHHNKISKLGWFTAQALGVLGRDGAAMILTKNTLTEGLAPSSSVPCLSRVLLQRIPMPGPGEDPIPAWGMVHQTQKPDVTFLQAITRRMGAKKGFWVLTLPLTIQGLTAGSVCPGEDSCLPQPNSGLRDSPVSVRGRQCSSFPHGVRVS